jgi:hypothetical protein
MFPRMLMTQSYGILLHLTQMSMILKEIFNEDLLMLAIWLNENKLTLNLNKTRSMIIGRKLYINISSMTVSVNNTEISNASNFKYLGVTITANFTWSEHIDRISAKVNQRLGLLHRIKHLLPLNARILFYNSLVLPIFDYADVVWGVVVFLYI